MENAENLWMFFEAGSVFGFAVAGMISICCVLFHDFMNFRNSKIETK